jgi:polyhydroxyalkanoate synthase
VEHLYRENQFMRGALRIGRQRIAAEHVRAPLVSIVDARCRLVPPRAVLPFHHAVGSRVRKLLWYRGDTGVALRHVGPLVGEGAHKRLWPDVMRWIHAQARAVSDVGRARR